MSKGSGDDLYIRAYLLIARSLFTTVSRTIFHSCGAVSRIACFRRLLLVPPVLLVASPANFSSGLVFAVEPLTRGLFRPTLHAGRSRGRFYVRRLSNATRHAEPRVLLEQLRPTHCACVSPNLTATVALATAGSELSSVANDAHRFFPIVPVGVPLTRLRGRAL